MEQNNWTQSAPYCVYMHTGPTGFVYIGQTCERLLSRRFRNGLGYQSSPHFFHAIQKYGWDRFEHTIIREGLTKKEADNLEIKLISKYKDLGISYNVTDGGEGCKRVVSDGTRAKISAANLGQIPWNKGLKGIYSPETRKRISDAQIGRKHSAEYKKLMSKLMSNRTIITKDGETKYVPNNILDEFLESGWTLGIGESRKSCVGRIQIHKGDKNKMVKRGEVQSYIDNGWELGMPDGFSLKCRKCTNMKWINNKQINKRIHVDEVQIYIDNGWELGRLKKPSE